MNGKAGQNAFSPSDMTAEPIAAPSAPLAVVRFQKKPSRKMASIPGVRKPVNSWMYWKAWSKLPNKGRATIIAISMAEMATVRPTATRCFSEVS